MSTTHDPGARYLVDPIVLEAVAAQRPFIRRALGAGRRLNGRAGESHGILNFNRVTKAPAEVPPIVVTVPAGCPEIRGAEYRQPSNEPATSVMTQITPAVKDDTTEPVEQGDDIEICPDCGRIKLNHVRHECLCEEAA